MKRHTRFFLTAIQILLLITLALPAGASEVQVKVKDIDLEKMSYQEGDYGWYLLKCTVENNTDTSGTVSVQLRSIDKYAYYRKDVELWGHVEAGEESVLSLKGFMDYKTLNDINKWEVKSIAFHH